jgi:large subunit ribosomal protein L15
MSWLQLSSLAKSLPLLTVRATGVISRAPQHPAFRAPHPFGTRGITSKDPSKIKLNTIGPNPGAVTKKTRVGRGIGSGLGKTAGRGHKGQKSRSGNGKPYPGFEGGQTPLFRKMRKHGFSNKLFSRQLTTVKLGELIHAIKLGRIDPTQTITAKHIFDSGLKRKIERGIKILGEGSEQLQFPLHLQVADVSESAREAIEATGGSVGLVFYDRISLRYTIKPEKFLLKPTFARPPPKLFYKYRNHPLPTPAEARNRMKELVEEETGDVSETETGTETETKTESLGEQSSGSTRASASL